MVRHGLGDRLQLRHGAAERLGEGVILLQQCGRVGGEPSGDVMRRGDPSGRTSSRHS